MVLIVLRHGESLWNQENRFTGWTDIQLSNNGVSEAIAAGNILKKYNFTHVFTSSLERTKETASYILNQSTNTCDNIINTGALDERNYGDLTGKNKHELKQEYGEEQVHTWRRSYTCRPPNGENLEDVRTRVGAFFDKEILPLLFLDTTILVVAHGNSLRALFVHLGIKDPTTIETFEIATGIPIRITTNNGGYDYAYENEYVLKGYQILDSRGYPTIEVACYDRQTNKQLGKGSSPSGASCGKNEVLELRDNDKKLYLGKSVFKAVKNIDYINKKMVLNQKTVSNLISCDNQLNQIDTSPMKSLLGGNTTTSVSFCLADVGAKMAGRELHEHISKTYMNTAKNNIKQLPTPLVNIINGGKHSVTGHLKIQEFMIYPREDIPLPNKIQLIYEVYHTLQKILVDRYGHQAKSIGDEGGFCPPISSAHEALEVIEYAIEQAGYMVGMDVLLALDCAASEFYDEETKLYEVETGKFLTSEQMIEYYELLIRDHPAVKSIEDGFHESDYWAWTEFSKRFSDKLMIVGDDLFTTNPRLIKQGLREEWANTLLLKVNQIGTISEAIEGAKLMFGRGNNVIVSHRSGETNHAYIIDIAVGIGAQYVKIGSPCRGERVAKFNRLIELYNGAHS